MRIKLVIFFLLLIQIIALPNVLAQKEGIPVCFDFQAPDAPTSLTVSGNVELSWEASIDGPENCSSGVDYYVIYRNNVLVDTTTSTSFSDGPLSDGTYTYKITAVDNVGNGEGPAASETITIETSEEEEEEEEEEETSSSSGGGGGGGGDSTSTSDDWKCGEWSACINGEQIQTCTHARTSATKKNKRLCVEEPRVEEEKEEVVEEESLVSEQEVEETPAVGQGLEEEGIEEAIAETEEENQTSRITGGGLGIGNLRIPWGFIVIVVALIAAIIVLISMLRPSKKK